MGLGENAHTASLMPFSAIVAAYSGKPTPDLNNQLVAALWVEELNMYRVTLTPPILNNSRQIIFLVTGANKALAVRNVLEGPTDNLRYPAQLIHAKEGKTIWYLDKEAAKLIPSP